MKKPKIVMNIIKEEVGYGAHVSLMNRSIFTNGDTWDELKENILDAVNLSFADKEWIYTLDEIKLKPDLHSFFEYYKVINAKALGARIGMSQSLLSAYINGIKKPSINQTYKILTGVKQLGRELADMHF